jgi:hypothetical protein
MASLVIPPPQPSSDRIDATPVERKVHKIYIGGIEPPKLTVDTVEKRIKSTLGDRIEFVSIDHCKAKTNAWGEDSRKFFFLTARVRENGDTATTSDPTGLLAKEYHNVKWKGCTLKVEPAKLSFLDRLEVERQDAIEEKLKKEEQMRLWEQAELTRMKEKKTPKVKRQLTIRKRHGEEKYVGRFFHKYPFFKTREKRALLANNNVFLSC